MDVVGTRAPYRPSCGLVTILTELLQTQWNVWGLTIGVTGYDILQIYTKNITIIQVYTN